METKRNHYVPQFYLRYFAEQNDKGVLWVYDKDGGEPRPQKPVDTGVENYLYTVQRETGEKDDSLERRFAELEGKTKPILERLIQPNVKIGEHEKPLIAAFMAFLHTRVPRQIEMVSEFGVALAQERMSQLAEDPERFEQLYSDYKRDTGHTDLPPVEEMRAAFADADEKYNLELSRKFALGMSLRMTDEFYAALGQLHWSICDAPSGSFFITCDSPVTSIALFDDGTAQFGANYVHPNFQVAFPVSPTALFYLSRKPRQSRWRCAKKFVGEMNRRTAYMAERFVYSSVPSEAIGKLVHELAVTRETSKIDKDEARRHMRESGLLSRHD